MTFSAWFSFSVAFGRRIHKDGIHSFSGKVAQLLVVSTCNVNDTPMLLLVIVPFTFL